MADAQVTAPAADGDWIGLAEAALALGFDSDVILRLIRDGDMPAIQIRGKQGNRTAHRLPRRLIDEARRMVFTGGQVELREFARQWSARNATAGAVA